MAKVNAAGIYTGPGNLYLGTHNRGRWRFLTPRRQNMLYQVVAIRQMSAALALGNITPAQMAAFAGACMKPFRHTVTGSLDVSGTTTIDIVGGVSYAPNTKPTYYNDGMQNDWASTVYNYDGEANGYYNWQKQFASVLLPDAAISGDMFSLVGDPANYIPVTQAVNP